MSIVKGFAFFIGFLFVCIVFGIGYHLWNVPIDRTDTEETLVTIPEGARVQEIATLLHEAELIRSPLGFLLRVQFSGGRGELRAGEYTFTRSESGSDILARMRQGDAHPRDVAVTIPEGFTIHQIAERLDEAGIVAYDRFIEIAQVEQFRSDYAFLDEVPDGPLEGYLFPDTYRFFRNADPRSIIRRFLSRFEEQFARAVEEVEASETHGIHDIVTMASIIEREVITEEDQRMVSGILWKRLRVGMRLDADATTRYVINDWNKELTVDDLATDSPYNTRRHGGLPPGAIGNPGLSSLKASLAPLESEYFYYLSAPDGRTIFSTTLEEHALRKVEYLRQ